MEKGKNKLFRFEYPGDLYFLISPADNRRKKDLFRHALTVG